MNLSKENNIDVNASENMEQTPAKPVVNISKNEDTQNNENGTVINLNKGEDNVAEQNVNVGNTPYTIPNPLDKIDMQKIEAIEAQATQKINNGIDNVVGHVENAFDKVSAGFNNFVDNLDKPKTASGQMNGQPNMNMNGQPNMNGMVTPNQLKVEPVVAALLSFLLTGLGQMVNGQIEKGLTLLLGGVAAVFIITIVTCGIGAISAPVLCIIAIVDAYKCAQILQSGRPIGKWEFHIFD